MNNKQFIISSPSRSSFIRSHMNQKPKRNSNTISTQTSTDLFVDDKEISLNEEYKQLYSFALEFINKFHNLLNLKLNEIYHTSGDNIFRENRFTVPEIPNYSSLLYFLTNTLKSHARNENVTDIERPDDLAKKNLSELTIPFNLLNQNLNSELNTFDYKAKFQSLLNNTTVHHTTAKYHNNSEEFDTDFGQIEADYGLEADTNSFDVSNGNELVDVDTQVSGNVKKQVGLVKSSFNIVNITPCINLINYSQNKEKMKKQKNWQYDKSNMQDVRDKQLFPYGNMRPNTPKKVKQMFDMVADKHDKYRTKMYPGFCKTEHNSDTDSIIFDDEEFERINQRVKVKNNICRFPENKPFVEKTNPLQLNPKDLTQVNQETLSAIGLFTNGGEIKPDILSILESQKSLRSNDVRNKQFRSKRQWDLQIHLKPKSDFNDSLPSVSSDILSYSSDIKIEVKNVKSQYTVH